MLKLTANSGHRNPSRILQRGNGAMRESASWRWACIQDLRGCESEKPPTILIFEQQLRKCNPNSTAIKLNGRKLVNSKVMNQP
jgi:hypothetical protein